MGNESSVWTIVHAAVSGFMIMPILTIGVLTLILARRRKDPARMSFVWLKGCHGCLVVSLSCIVSADILNVILFSWQNDAGLYDTSTHSHEEISSFIRSERYLSFTGNLFEHFVDVLFILILSELGSGLLRSLDGRPSPYQLRIRYAACGAAALLAGLAFAYFAQPTNAWIAYWNGAESNSSYAQLTQSLKIVGKLGASFYIPSWTISVCQLAYASFVMYKHKAGVRTRRIAMLYLAVTTLDLTRWTLFLVLYAVWILPGLDNPWWWNLVEALGNTWIRTTQLTLLLLIGMRRRKGIWTTHQPWMTRGTAAAPTKTIPEMSSSTNSDPSPVMAPGTVYHQQQQQPHAPYPSSRDEHAAAMQQQQQQQHAWYLPQPLPAWPQHDMAALPPVIVAPREMELTQYHYAPHPVLGPGYLVLQAHPPFHHYQQQQHHHLHHHQQQQSPIPPPPPPLTPVQEHIGTLQHQQSFHSQHRHQPSFQF